MGGGRSGKERKGGEAEKKIQLNETLKKNYIVARSGETGLHSHILWRLRMASSRPALITE